MRQDLRLYSGDKALTLAEVFHVSGQQQLLQLQALPHASNSECKAH